MKFGESKPFEAEQYQDIWEIPEGWSWISLENAMDKVIDYRGRTPPISESGLPHLTTSNIRDGKINWETKKFVTPETYEKYMTRGIPEPGDIFFTMEGPLGEVAVLNEKRKFSLAQRILLLRPKKEIFDSRFLAYSLVCPNIRTSIDLKATGSGVTGVAYKRLKDLQLPLPPLAEQHRIVARVEALLSQVNAARERLSRVPLIMKKFRQAVLAAACCGRLTEGWREENLDVEPAQLILERISRDREGFSDRKKNLIIESDFDNNFPFEIPDYWVWTQLEDVLKNPKNLSYGILKPGDLDPDGVPMVRVMDIGDWGLNETNIVRVSPLLASQYERTKLEVGDILLAVMATVGRAIVVPPSLKGANVNRALAVIKLHSQIDPHYACNVIRSPYFQDTFETEKIGSAQLRINISDLRKFSFPLPPLAEQHEIVRRVGMLFERADAVDREIAAAGRRCERLTQAVLGKAFAGKL